MFHFELNIKVVDSHVGLFFSLNMPYTFRSVLVHGKEQASQKKIFHNRAKKSS